MAASKRPGKKRRPQGAPKKSPHRAAKKSPRRAAKKKPSGPRRRPSSARSNLRVTPAVSDVESDGKMRLNRFLAGAGVCSRRAADTIIAAGRVTVNGAMVNHPSIQR